MGNCGTDWQSVLQAHTLIDGPGSQLLDFMASNSAHVASTRRGTGGQTWRCEISTVRTAYHW